MNVRRKEYGVTVRHGQFAAMIDGSEYKHATWDGLYALLLRATASAAALDIHFVSSRDGKRGVLTAIHARNDNLVVKWKNGTSEQISRFCGEHMRDLSTAEHKKFMALRTQCDRATEALESFIDKNRIDLHQVARDAIEARLQEPDSPESKEE